MIYLDYIENSFWLVMTNLANILVPIIAVLLIFQIIRGLLK